MSDYVYVLLDLRPDCGFAYAHVTSGNYPYSNWTFTAFDEWHRVALRRTAYAPREFMAQIDGFCVPTLRTFLILVAFYYELNPQLLLEANTTSILWDTAYTAWLSSLVFGVSFNFKNATVHQALCSDTYAPR